MNERARTGVRTIWGLPQAGMNVGILWNVACRQLTKKASPKLNGFGI